MTKFRGHLDPASLEARVAAIERRFGGSASPRFGNTTTPTLTSLRERIETLEATVADHETRITDLEAFH